MVSISADMGVIPFGRCRRLAPVTPRSRRPTRERIGRRAASGRPKAPRVVRRVAPTTALRRRRHRLRAVPQLAGSVYAPGMASLPNRVSWWLTAVSAGWAGALLAVEWPDPGPLSVGMAAWFGAATWLVTRWPWLGVALTAGGVLALGLMGSAGRERRATWSGPDRARHDRLPAVTACERVGRPRPAGRDRDRGPLAPAQRHLRAGVAGAPLVVRGARQGSRRSSSARGGGRSAPLTRESLGARTANGGDRARGGGGRCVHGDRRRCAPDDRVSRRRAGVARADRDRRHPPSGEEATQRLRTLLVLLREEPHVADPPSDAGPARPHSAPPAVAALLGGAALLAIPRQ